MLPDRIKSTRYWPLIGSAAALVASPLVVWISGKENYYALALLPLILLLWAATGLKKEEMGLKLGKVKAYSIAFYYPLFVMGSTILISWISGQISPRSIADQDITAAKAALLIALLFFMTLIFAFLTEEGFFRGWLWGCLEIRGLKLIQKLIWTSSLFSLWHFAVTMITPSFTLRTAVIPIYLGNVFLIGLIFAMIRHLSCSLVAPSLAHAIWNTLQYTLFGSGGNYALLGISSFWIFDPERGLLGIVLNILAFTLIWKWYVRERDS